MAAGFAVFAEAVSAIFSGGEALAGAGAVLGGAEAAGGAIGAGEALGGIGALESGVAAAGAGAAGLGGTEVAGLGALGAGAGFSLADAGLGAGAATGADLDLAFGGGASLGGGAGAAFNPSLFESAGSLISSGGFSLEAAQPFINGLGTAGRGISTANSAGQLISGLESRQKAKQIQAMMKASQGNLPYGSALPDPSEVTKTPGYQAGLEAVRRTMASQGYAGSGNMMAALSKYGGDAYNQFVTQRQSANIDQLRQNQGKLSVAQALAGPATANASALPLIFSGGAGLLRAAL